MPNEFSKIKDFAGWKTKLNELLAAAEKASSRNDDEERLAVAKRLNQFVLESSPNTDDILTLDELATNAARELSTSLASDAVDRIVARTAALRSIAKQLEAVSTKAEQDAASIRLTRAHRVVDAFTEAVRAIETLDGVLDGGSDEQLRKRLTKLVETLRGLRTEVDESLGRPS